MSSVDNVVETYTQRSENKDRVSEKEKEQSRKNQDKWICRIKSESGRTLRDRDR